jgi:hypothetical protein
MFTQFAPKSLKIIRNPLVQEAAKHFVVGVAAASLADAMFGRNEKNGKDSPCELKNRLKP